jgi:Transposase DDE domain group 1
MPTECNPALFDFAPVETRRVVAGFDGGAITSNAGALLLGATDRAIGLVRRFAACFRDARAPERIEHEAATLVGQRVFGIALGHEDLVDHDLLRHDPVLAILAGKLEARRAGCAPLAGKSTLNRLEHAPSGEPGRYHRIGHDAAAIEALFVDLFLDAHRSPPRQIILDLDATDVPLHGHQEGRFFGLARNPRLAEELAIDLAWAEEEATHTGRSARRYRDFRWSTLDSWSRRRRVIGKAEWTRGEPNPVDPLCGSTVVTSLKRGEIDARVLYERVYCARGDMENRVKECQLDLFAGRASAATMQANQLRLWFASMAYVLLCALRRIGLAHTHFAEATCGTLRLALLRIGAQVRRSVRRIKLAMASAHPFQDEFALAHARLAAATGC